MVADLNSNRNVPCMLVSREFSGKLVYHNVSLNGMRLDQWHKIKKGEKDVGRSSEKKI